MVCPASSMCVARTIPSSADWPVPKRSLSARSASASLTASTGQRARSGSERRCTRPLRVSSVAPRSERVQARR